MENAFKELKILAENVISIKDRRLEYARLLLHGYGDFKCTQIS